MKKWLTIFKLTFCIGGLFFIFPVSGLIAPLSCYDSDSPNPYDRKKNRYIFGAIGDIEIANTYIYGECEPNELHEFAQSLDIETDELIDELFLQKGFNPEKLRNFHKDYLAYFQTEVVLHEKTALVKVGIYGQGVLKPLQIYIPSIIWDEIRLLVIDEDKTKTKQQILDAIKIMTMHFLDEYQYAQ